MSEITVKAGIANKLIQKAMEGDNACMIFYLKTRGGWKETVGVEHSGGVANTQVVTLEMIDERMKGK